MNYCGPDFCWASFRLLKSDLASLLAACISFGLCLCCCTSIISMWKHEPCQATSNNTLINDMAGSAFTYLQQIITTSAVWLLWNGSSVPPISFIFLDCMHSGAKSCCFVLWQPVTNVGSKQCRAVSPDTSQYVTGNVPTGNERLQTVTND